METAILTVSMGVMKPLLSKLTKLLGEEYVKITGVHKKIEFLRDELSSMSATLEMLADAEKLTAEMSDWRDKLRELAYDIDDYVDTIKDRADRGGLKAFEGFIPKMFQLKRHHKFANEMADLEKRAIAISDRHKRYSGFVQGQAASSSHNSFIDPRLSWLYEETQNLVGIDGPKNRVIELLGIGTTRRQVVSIVGCGGLGKTTLAKQIFDTIKSDFECAAFVCLSRSPDWRAILRQIAQEVGIKENNSLINGNVHQLINILREHLKDKRYFIVIDDVWQKQDWTNIMPVLLNNNSMSRIITTTRNFDIAKCCSSDQGDCVYTMEVLSYDDSKRLFLKRAFGSDHSYYPHLKVVLEKIVYKCGGLPLAIITVSSMLANEHAVAEWDKVLRVIGSSLAKKPNAEIMTSILSLSYFDIPHHLRTCLLYLSVYPEDYKIEKQCLVNRWIAEGFIHEEDGQTNKYEIGEGYLINLINRSMIQPVNIKYGQAEVCRVHDIIHDYIKCKAAEENFVTLLDGAQPIYTSEYKARRLCVNNHIEGNVTLWADQILSRVRSVTIFGQPVKFSLLPSTALRVLDLGECSGMIQHHFESIEKFFHLKYLRLSFVFLPWLPDKVGELQYLHTLDLRSTGISTALPWAITKLQRLANLYVDYFVIFPYGMIREMHNLEELREYGVQSSEQAKSLQEFCELTKLRTLEIKYFESTDRFRGARSQPQVIYSYVENLLSSSCNLHNLYLMDFPLWYPVSLDSWHPGASSSLHKLCIERGPTISVPNWMGTLQNLGVLELEMLCVRPEDIEILGKIPRLFFLKLGTIGATSGRIVVHGNNLFRSLKYFFLCIQYCGTWLEFEEGSMPKLEHFKLQFHVHEKCMNNGPSGLGIQHLSTLSNVEILIYSDKNESKTYDPAEDNDDDTVRCVSRAINAAIEKFPNRPTVRFSIQFDPYCHHFKDFLSALCRTWSLMEWSIIWQIEKEQVEQATHSEAKQEDEDEEEERGANFCFENMH